jgi:hypothetical protein
VFCEFIEEPGPGRGVPLRDRVRKNRWRDGPSRTRAGADAFGRMTHVVFRGSSTRIEGGGGAGRRSLPKPAARTWFGDDLRGVDFRLSPRRRFCDQADMIDR